jgi:hypothetical protein
MEETSSTRRVSKYAVPDRGSRAVQALEESWEKLRAVHPSIPLAVLTLVDVRSRSHVRGYFAKSSWKKRRGQAHEVGISPELIGHPEYLVATMVHEAAHAVLHERGQAGGMGRGGYYHKATFRDQCQSFGLQCEFYNTRYGWTLTSWPNDRIPDGYRPIASFLRQALPAGVDGLRPATRPGRKLPLSGHTKLICRCKGVKRSVYVNASVLKAGGVMCRFCGQVFRPTR